MKNIISIIESNGCKVDRDPVYGHTLITNLEEGSNIYLINLLYRILSFRGEYIAGWSVSDDPDDLNFSGAAAVLHDSFKIKKIIILGDGVEVLEKNQTRLSEEMALDFEESVCRRLAFSKYDEFNWILRRRFASNDIFEPYILNK